jgi:HEAT repeat protein
LPELLGALIEPGAAGRWQVDEAAATELEKSSITAKTLLVAARNNEAKVRRGAWYLLAEKFDIHEAANQSQLRAALADDDAIVRALALRIVSELPEPELPMLVEPLAGLLSSAELTTENRAAIARLLGRLKEQATIAEEPLAQAARNDKQARVRAACLVALWQIAEPAANLPRFRAALQDVDASVRLVAAARLREMGPDAAIAAEGLARSLEDQDDRVREAAAEALIRIGEPAVKPLMGELAAESPAARRWAVFALAKLGAAAKSAQAELEKVSSNEREEEETRKMAALAVKRLGL